MNFILDKQLPQHAVRETPETQGGVEEGLAQGVQSEVHHGQVEWSHDHTHHGEPAAQ